MILYSFNERLTLKLGIIIVIHRKTTTCNIYFSNSYIKIFYIELNMINLILFVI